MWRRGANPSTGKRVAWLLALACALLAGACSTLKLGYNHVDTLAVYTLNRYFDLDDAQQALARERARALVAWHRETQLRGYVDLIESAGRRLDERLGADDVLAFYVEMNRRLELIGARAAPELAALALTLTPAQIDHCADRLARDNAKARRESGRDSLDGRIRTAVERAKDWFGSVTPQQERLIRAHLGQQPDNHAWWLAERERRQRELIALLRRIQSERPAAVEAAHWFEAYFARLALPSDPERQAALQRYRLANAALIAQLIDVATPAQRAALLSKLRGYAEDFAALAAAGARG